MAQNIKQFKRGVQDYTRAPTVQHDFTAQYEQHQQGIYRYVLARIGHVEDAQDITSQVFVKAYENADSYRGDAPFAHWLYRIARNQITDYFRRRRENTPLNETAPIASDQNTIEAVMMRKQRLKRVADALDSLSEDRREAVSLRLFAGLSNQEIAEVMNRSADAVAMLVYRSIQILKDRLAEENVV